MTLTDKEKLQHIIAFAESRLNFAMERLSAGSWQDDSDRVSKINSLGEITAYSSILDEIGQLNQKVSNEN